MNKDSESNDHICKNSKCKDVLLVTDSTTGEVMCSSCGQVVSQNMAELGPESAQSGEDYNSKQDFWENANKYSWSNGEYGFLKEMSFIMVNLHHQNKSEE